MVVVVPAEATYFPALIGQCECESKAAYFDSSLAAGESFDPQASCSTYLINRGIPQFFLRNQKNERSNETIPRARLSLGIYLG
jgi:hypothetical protein